MQVLGDLTPASYFTDFRFCCLPMCRMVKVSLQYGVIGHSAEAFGYWGTALALSQLEAFAHAPWTRMTGNFLLGRKV
jgi:hypothetical protein